MYVTVDFDSLSVYVAPNVCSLLSYISRLFWNYTGT